MEIVAWGHEWQLGYAKHPPLVAWLAEAARLIGGSNGVWPIYLLGQLCVVTAFWAVWRLGLRDREPWIGLAGVLVMETTGRYTWMTLEFNHSLVVLPFFALTALFLYRALVSGRAPLVDCHGHFPGSRAQREVHDPPAGRGHRGLPDHAS